MSSAILVISSHVQANNVLALKDVSLGELINIPITITSRHDQSSFEASSAVYTISQEDIKRSGLQSIPELLRAVSRIDVAQINANKWAIKSCGFNSLFANKMLVMIEGRAVYDSLYASVKYNDTRKSKEGNALFRCEHKGQGQSGYSLQAYAEYINRQNHLIDHKRSTLDVVARNILDSQHLEYVNVGHDNGVLASEVERSLYAQLKYSFD